MPTCIATARMAARLLSVCILCCGCARVGSVKVALDATHTLQADTQAVLDSYTQECTRLSTAFYALEKKRADDALPLDLDADLRARVLRAFDVEAEKAQGFYTAQRERFVAHFGTLYDQQRRLLLHAMGEDPNVYLGMGEQIVSVAEQAAMK